MGRVAALVGATCGGPRGRAAAERTADLYAGETGTSAEPSLSNHCESPAWPTVERCAVHLTDREMPRHDYLTSIHCGHSLALQEGRVAELCKERDALRLRVSELESHVRLNRCLEGLPHSEWQLNRCDTVSADTRLQLSVRERQVADFQRAVHVRIATCHAGDVVSEAAAARR